MQQIFNQEIREHLDFEPQELKVNFTFRTNKENESRGRFDLTHKSANNKTAKEVIRRNFYLNEKIDSLAKLPLIKPIRENNIFIITEDEINTSALWNYSTLTINGSIPYAQLHKIYRTKNDLYLMRSPQVGTILPLTSCPEGLVDYIMQIKQQHSL